MADNIITPVFRGAYVQIFHAKAQKQEDGTMGKAKFQIRAVFDPNTDLSQMKAEAEAAVAEKWGADKTKWPKSLRSPFRRNEELDNPIVGADDDAIVVTFSANEDRRPGVVDASCADVIDDSECYSGAYYRAQVRAFAYDHKGNRGVAFGLQNVQKMKDGEPLGGRIPASKAFDAVDTSTDTSKGASALFD